MTDEGNGQRVTNALLQKDIGTLSEDFKEFRDDFKRWRESIEKRVSDLEQSRARREGREETKPVDKPPENERLKALEWARDKLAVPLAMGFLFWFLFQVLPSVIQHLQTP